MILKVSFIQFKVHTTQNLTFNVSDLTSNLMIMLTFFINQNIFIYLNKINAFILVKYIVLISYLSNLLIFFVIIYKIWEIK